MKNLNLSGEIYSLESIEAAVKAFATHGKICVKTNRNFFTVSFSQCRYDEELTAKAFENYLIGIENSKK